MTKKFPNGAIAHYDEDRKLHAEGVPATTHPDGSFAWFCHGLLHREDGPAVFAKNGDGAEISEYWVRGRRMAITEKLPGEQNPRQVWPEENMASRPSLKTSAHDER